MFVQTCYCGSGCGALYPQQSLPKSLSLSTLQHLLRCRRPHNLNHSKLRTIPRPASFRLRLTAGCCLRHAQEWAGLLLGGYL